MGKKILTRPVFHPDFFTDGNGFLNSQFTVEAGFISLTQRDFLTGALCAHHEGLFDAKKCKYT